MVENPTPEEGKITEDIKNLFRLKKELNDNPIRDITNLFKQQKETKAIKYRILCHIKTLFEHGKEEKNYDKPVRGNNFWSNYYIEYKSNGETNKTL